VVASRIRENPGQVRGRGAERLTDQVELVGAACWLLRQAKLVSWDDLFTEGGDPRDFDRVVRAKGPAFEQLVAAGVAEAVARRAGGH
jgi:hypothetical protein